MAAGDDNRVKKRLPGLGGVTPGYVQAKQIWIADRGLLPVALEGSSDR